MPRFARAALALALTAAIGSCAGPRGHGALEWVAGCVVPRFDPDGPPDDVRWAIERLLSQGLTRERPDGTVEGAAAERYEAANGGLTWTFHLRGGLRFTDGHPCTSADFRAALAGGLAREDHSTRAALLDALRGVRPARPGRAKPALGIETPDPRTIVLRLARPDSLLPLELALPGVSTPWRSRMAGDWSGAIGIGPYRLARSGGGNLVMARASGAGPDSIRLRFVIGLARLRSVLRSGQVDVLWPPPPELLNQPVPTGFRIERSEARPQRTLLLVMRADTPPTSLEAARRALAHGVNRSEVVATLGPSATPAGELIPGAGPFDAPRYDATEVASWMAKGELGKSFRVTLLFDADRSGGAVARVMQGTWARQNLYVELDGLRGSDYERAAIAGHEHLVLAERQPLESGVSFAALGLAEAWRVPPVGTLRTGWHPAGWPGAHVTGGAAHRPSAALIEGLLERDLVVIPLADLPWVRMVREGGPGAPFHPHFGPDFASSAPRSAAGTQSPLRDPAGR